MSYKGQVLRGEKWYHLFPNEDYPENGSIKEDVKVYLESVEKVKKSKKEK